MRFPIRAAIEQVLAVEASRQLAVPPDISALRQVGNLVLHKVPAFRPFQNSSQNANLLVDGCVRKAKRLPMFNKGENHLM
jgi:hypothetical protein